MQGESQLAQLDEVRCAASCGQSQLLRFQLQRWKNAHRDGAVDVQRMLFVCQHALIELGRQPGGITLRQPDAASRQDEQDEDYSGQHSRDEQRHEARATLAAAVRSMWLRRLSW